jgi:DNA-binding beta-propeller fold protein YncE
MRLAFCALVPVAIAACSSNSGPLGEPISNKQADDPCDPGSVGTSGGSLPPVDAGSVPVTLPGASPGIGFDDIRFSATLSEILVPAGRSGNLDFVDPSSEVATPVGGFASSPSYTAGDDSFGATSADEGGGIVYATDRTNKTLTVIDGRTRKVVTSAMLADTPGYVRFVAATNEVWVTEPASSKIEIFALPMTEKMPPTSSAVLSVQGAESLAIDSTSGMAFTNGASSTYAIDITKRMVAAPWSNGCKTARGLAVDSAHGWVMVACEAGLVSVIDEQTGKTIGGVTTGAGIDQVGYQPATLRLYVPSPTAGAMAVIHLDPKSGMPTILGSVDTTMGSHCVVAAGGREVFVCAPATGQLLFVNDPF